MYRFALRSCWLLLLFLAAEKLVFSQSQPVLDSLNQRLVLLRSLTQSGNFEQAQVEAEGFRAFLLRQQLAVPTQAVPIISSIYQANKDSVSAAAFFATVERDARLQRNPEAKVALLKALTAAYERWGQVSRALGAYRSLSVAQDTEAARRLVLETLALHRTIDSLQTLRMLEGHNNPNIVQMDLQRAWILAGITGLVLLALLFANARTGSRWHKRLNKRELEMEIERANDRKAFEQMLATPPPAVVPPEKTIADPLEFVPDNAGAPDKIALLIEPNRQVVIYLKSLLSDRFRVETALTANDGLQRAADLLPDLIVCDAVLNGKTGIDVARQIKLSERTNHIPVILLSAHHGNEGKLDALRAGAEAWFTRPVLDDEFDASVQRLLNARKDKHDDFVRALHFWFTDHRETLDNLFLNQTMQLIEQHLGDPDFMADDLAKKMQLSRSHFVKKLGVLTGKEPIQLIREMRLEKAKVLLEKRAGTPQAIADLVGFSNPGTFALAFKEYFGENTLLLQTPPSRLS